MLGVLCSRPEQGSSKSDSGKESKSHGPQRFEFTTGYRYLPSYRHFIGTVEQKQREVLGTQIRNNVHMFDFSLSYMVTPKLSVNASIPLIKVWRNQLYNPRGIYSFVGQGDATVGVRTWLLGAPSERLANIGIGASVKLPSGRYNLTAPALNAQGQQIIATADQSVQLGDGGTGLSLDLSAYKATYFRTWLYFQTTYLFNPRNTNGVTTNRTRRFEDVMSVSDQYLVRGGVTRLVPKVRRLAASFGGRWEGVPVRDLIGKSNGFRRPGYAISIEPGLMYGRGSYTFSALAPWAIERNRRRSVPDIANRVHGDAAFADYSVILSVTRRF